MPFSNKVPSSNCSMYIFIRVFGVILKIRSSKTFFVSFSNFFKDELNNKYLSNSKEVTGLIAVLALKVLLGFTILKPKTDNREIAIIEAILQQTIC